MTVDEYFDYLIKLKEKKDYYLLHSTIEANKHTYKVNPDDVKYLKRVIAKIRHRYNDNLKKEKKLKKEKRNEKRLRINNKATIMNKSDINNINNIVPVKKISAFNTTSVDVESPIPTRKESRMSSLEKRSVIKSIDKKEALISPGWHKKEKSGKFNHIKRNISNLNVRRQNMVINDRSSFDNTLRRDVKNIKMIENMEKTINFKVKDEKDAEKRKTINEKKNSNKSNNEQNNSAELNNDENEVVETKHSQVQETKIQILSTNNVNKDNNTINNTIANNVEKTKNLFCTEIENKDNNDNKTSNEENLENINSNEENHQYTNNENLFIEQQKAVDGKKLNIIIEVPEVPKEVEEHRSKTERVNQKLPNKYFTIKRSVDLLTYSYVLKKEAKSVKLYEYEYFLSLQKGMVFGDSALESINSKRNATILASEPTHLGIIEGNTYSQLLKQERVKAKFREQNFLLENFFLIIQHNLFSKKYWGDFIYKEFIKGEVLFKEKDDVDYIYFIKSGGVSTTTYQSLLGLNLIAHEMSKKCDADLSDKEYLLKSNPTYLQKELSHKKEYRVSKLNNIKTFLNLKPQS